MYAGWAERRGYAAETVAEAEEPVRVVLRIVGPGAYGYLSGESGLHRRLEEEKRQRAYVRVHSGDALEDLRDIQVNGREVRRREGAFVDKVRAEASVRDETSGRVLTLVGGVELEDLKDIASRVVKGQGGHVSVDEARPVSYTHLTLPTNREV